MNRSTEEFVAGLGPTDLDVLEISGTGWGDFGFRSHRSVDYPAFDICTHRTQSYYDLIIAEQVLEHVRRPDLAVRNMLNMLHPGGVALITTPFLVQYHPSPVDLWRWTAAGLYELLCDAGFERIDVHSWGNKACAIANMNDPEYWPPYDSDRHSLENEPLFPLVVWAFAWRSVVIDPIC
jgi:hypothetical protein